MNKVLPWQWSDRPGTLPCCGIYLVMSKQGALEELIKSMFNDAELRSFLGQRPDAGPLLAGLPGGSASLLHVMFEAIMILERHRIIDGEFFAALVAVRPRCQQEIQEVAAMWGLTLPAASEARTTTTSGSTPSTAATTSAPPPASSPSRSGSAIPTPATDKDHHADVAILIALTEEWEVFWPIAGESAPALCSRQGIAPMKRATQRYGRPKPGSHAGESRHPHPHRHQRAHSPTRPQYARAQARTLNP